MINLDKDLIRGIFRGRPLESHKGNYGKLLIIAGSLGMMGAATLCAKAALRGGAGLVTLAVPEHLFPILQISVPEAMCIARDDKLNQLISQGKFDGIVFGPGLGKDKDDRDILKWILANFDGSMVIDADGLNHLANNDLLGACKNSKAQIVLTPHMGEAARLLDIQKVLDRPSAAKEIADKYKATAILKGHETLIATPNTNEVYKNSTGNPGMATAGSGDVLAGIVGAWLVQGYSPLHAGQLGVFAHGYSGDICANSISQTSIIAGDIVEFLPVALKELLE